MLKEVLNEFKESIKETLSERDFTLSNNCFLFLTLSGKTAYMDMSSLPELPIEAQKGLIFKLIGEMDCICLVHLLKGENTLLAYFNSANYDSKTIFNLATKAIITDSPVEKVGRYSESQFTDFYKEGNSDIEVEVLDVKKRDSKFNNLNLN